ncbi:MAG: glycosyl transferase group 1 [Solirubrobacterales bacterium]|nr:glycosyl transferase group 1 [Solirubrobacterales bacterium]
MFVAPVAVEGGVAEVLYGLVRHAEAGGYRADVVFLRPGPAVAGLARLGARVRVLDAQRMRSPRAVGRTMRSFSTLLRAARPAVVVGMEPSAQIYTALPARWNRIPVVWEQHATVDPASLVERIARLLPARRVIANSEFVAAGLRARTRVTVAVVHPGVAVERFAAADGAQARAMLGVADGGLVVGIVGRLQPWKGQDLFLRAAARIAARHPEVRVVVVGGAEMGWETGDYPGELRALCNQLGIGERVTFTGQVADAAPWFAACDLLVSASAAEPYGLSICEAQAAGTAVIAMAEGGPLEIVEDEVDGLLCAREDGALAASIDRLLSDPELRHRLAARGAVKAREHHDARRMCADTGRELRAALA